MTTAYRTAHDTLPHKPEEGFDPFVIKGAPSVFDSSGEDAGAPACPLDDAHGLDGGAVWLRYDFRAGDRRRRTSRPPPEVIHNVQVFGRRPF
jgi:hypothetical protein